MKFPVETLGSGLGHPEGPDVLPYGRIVMVETYTSKIIAWSPERGIHDYAICGGGPNACMLGSDGAVYITQNGGTVGAWKADVMSVPSIQKAWPDGRVEFAVKEVAGYKLQAPNDLTFGPDGRLFFTDPGDYYPDNRGMGRIFAVNPDGSGELLDEIPASYPNGITAEKDGSIIWVESYDRGVYRIRPGGKSEQIAQLPEKHVPDGLKIDEKGNLWITAFMGGGVDILRPDGSYVDFLETGGVPLNCVFYDDNLIITDFGDITAVTAEAPMDGRLWRIPVGVRGMKLFRGKIG